MINVLDMAVVDELLSLSDDGDPELLLDLIRLFLADGPTKLQAIQLGLTNVDFDQVERASHSLKGSSGNLGARQLQNTCEQLQLAARNRQLAPLQLFVPQLAAQFEEVRRALVALQHRYQPH